MDVPVFSTPDGGRIGSSQGLYFSICERSFCDFLAFPLKIGSAANRLDSVKCLGGDDETFNDAHEELRKLRAAATASAVSAIVFATMCLEAAIYDYAAWHLGDHYVKMHLDKLDLVSKWLVVPKLVARREIPIGRPSYEHLKALVRLRNDLVHNKSSPIPFRDEDLHRKIQELEVKEDKIQKGCIVAIRAIVLVSLDMDHLFGGVTINPLPSFAENSPTHYRPRYSDELEVLISECRGMLNRSRENELTLAKS